MPLYPAAAPVAPNAALDTAYVNEGDHTKAVHDALAIDSGSVGGSSAAALKARANHTGTQAIATLSDHTKAAHDSLTIDAGTVGTASAAQLRDRSTHTGTQAVASLSDHTKAAHDALAIDAGTLGGSAAAAFATSGHSHGAGTISVADALVKAMGQAGMMGASGAGSAIVGALALSAATQAAASTSASSGSDGIGFFQQTAATTGQTAYVESGAAVIRADGLPSVMIKFKAGTVLTVIRMFIGLTSAAVATELGADANVADKVGIQFSTARGDTAWQWCTANGTTQTIATTGNAPGNFARFLRLVWTSTTSVTATLLNSAGTSITSATLTATLPAATVGMRILAGTTTLENVAKTQTFYYANLVTQPFAA